MLDGFLAAWQSRPVKSCGPSGSQDLAFLDRGLGFASSGQEIHAADPTTTDPDKYKVVFENERVRVLEYRDEPGERTSPHGHPDSVMYTLSSFDRRLVAGSGESRDVRLVAGELRWLSAQTHSGEIIGATPTHVLFVELKTPAPSDGEGALGPSS